MLRRRAEQIGLALHELACHEFIAAVFDESRRRLRRRFQMKLKADHVAAKPECLVLACWAARELAHGGGFAGGGGGAIIVF